MFEIQVWDLILVSCLGFGFEILILDSGFGCRFWFRFGGQVLDSSSRVRFGIQISDTGFIFRFRIHV